MKIFSKSTPDRAARFAPYLRAALLSGALAATATAAQAQNIFASGEISGLQAGPGVYDYTMTIRDSSSATTPIASFWYAWVPGAFFLPSVPTSAAGPAGWSASIVANSIQYSSGSAATDITPGSSMTFTYVASFSPAQLAAAANSGVTIAYAGAVDASLPSDTFTVQIVPEPSVAVPFLSGLAGLSLAVRRRLRTA